MIVQDDSPLHRLPNGLPVPIVQLLDGIRYAIMMADLSYCRLAETMATVFRDDRERPHRIATAAFLDAWAMIDSLNRLRNLLPRAYRQKIVPQVKVFLRDTTVIKSLRDSIQHADERIRGATPFALPGTPPMWGTLECMAPGPDASTAKHARLTPGTRAFTWAASPIAHSPYPTAPVDHIALTAFDQEILLTEVHDSLMKLTRKLEHATPKLPETVSFADMLMILNVPYDPPEPEGGTTG